MAIDAGRLLWLRSFLIGRLISPPGVRLYGTVGARRLATTDELRQIRQRIQRTRWLKGNRLLWSSLTQVRDMQFTSFSPVTYPVMMEGLWGK